MEESRRTYYVGSIPTDPKILFEEVREDYSKNSEDPFFEDIIIKCLNKESYNKISDYINSYQVVFVGKDNKKTSEEIEEDMKNSRSNFEPIRCRHSSGVKYLITLEDGAISSKK